MLKKNLSKRVTSAVLAMFFLFSSVTLVSFAALSKGKKSRNSNLTASDIMEAYDIAKGNGIDIDDCEYDYSDNDGKSISPGKEYEYKKWKNSALNDDNYETENNNFKINYGYGWEEEEEEEWNEPTKKEDEKLGNNSLTAEEENNNLNDNDGS